MSNEQGFVEYLWLTSQFAARPMSTAARDLPPIAAAFLTLLPGSEWPR